jgi:hypothetical protein
VSANALYSEALGRLGRGDEVGVAETLKAEAAANVELLEEQLAAEPEPEPGTAEEQVQAFLSAHEEVNERLLAVAFPAIEYGSERLVTAVRLAAAHLVRPTAQVRSGSVLRPAAGVVVAGRVLWAMATYALYCTRIEAIAALDSITIRPPNEERHGIPLYCREEFRYPHAFNGDAGKSYEHYRTWLSERPLVTESVFLLSAGLDETFAETDLLLALRMLSTVRYGTYSGGAEPPTVRRLADRFRDPRQRPGLAALFRVGDDQLDELVEACYQNLEFDRNRFWGGLPSHFLLEEKTRN